MKLKMICGFWFLTELLLIPTRAIGVELDRYQHVTDSVILSVGRGITLFDKELESDRTEEISLGVQLVPDVLHLTVPFSNFEVDTRGGVSDVLPIGTIHVNTVGLALTWAVPWRWSPFVGIGGNFYSFDENFLTPANIQNTFGLEGCGGLRIRLIENIFDAAQLHGTIAYQFNRLKPGISMPDKPEIDNISLNRHHVVFRLELSGL